MSSEEKVVRGQKKLEDFLSVHRYSVRNPGLKQHLEVQERLKEMDDEYTKMFGEIVWARCSKDGPFLARRRVQSDGVEVGFVQGLLQTIGEHLFRVFLQFGRWWLGQNGCWFQDLGGRTESGV